MNCIITLTTKNIVIYHKNYSGIMKLSPNNTNLDSIFRQILDFCFSKSVICKIPREINFYFDNHELLKVIMDGLYHIFLALPISIRDNKFIEFYQNRYLVENMEEIP